MGAGRGLSLMIYMLLPLYSSPPSCIENPALLCTFPFYLFMLGILWALELCTEAIGGFYNSY